MIVVHHLNFSRSTRVLWLMEELGLPYEVVRYQRNAQFRAPPELAQVHPLGKAPVIVDGDLVLAESAVILDYIDSRYGGGRLTPSEPDRKVIHEEWLQYVESSAAIPIMLTLIGQMTGGLSGGLAAFAGPATTKTFDYIQDGVGAGPYVMGEQFTLADIQFAYPLEMSRRAGLLDSHSGLQSYLDRLAARPAYQKALEVGGPMAPPKN